MTGRSTTTAADIAAAIALGVMPGDAPIITAEQAAEQAEQAARAAVADALAVESARQARRALDAPTLDAQPTAEHRCTQRGCSHGAHTTGQPDRQLKLAAPCGAILRMTGRALTRAGGEVRCGHGDLFAVDTTRRAYRQAVAAPAAIAMLAPASPAGPEPCSHCGSTRSDRYPVAHASGATAIRCADTRSCKARAAKSAR